MTFVWSFVLVAMLNYVVSSVLGAPYEFMDGVYLSIGVFVIALIFTAIIPKEAVGEESEQH